MPNNKQSMEEMADQVWKAWPTSVLLCSVGAVVALWALETLPIPGISIAILGVVAAIMSLRGGDAANRESSMDADYICVACG